MKPLILVILVLSLGFFITQLFQEALVYHRDLIKQGEWWRIITGNFIHSNYPHLFLNLSGLWILGFLFLDQLKTKTFIFSILLLSLFIGLGLYFFDTTLQKYYGFSGVLYGLFIIGGVSALIEKDYFNGIAVLVFVLAKLIWDLIYGGNASSEALIGMPVAVHAHLYGIVSACVLGIVLYILQIKLQLKQSKTVE